MHASTHQLLCSQQNLLISQMAVKVGPAFASRKPLHFHSHPIVVPLPLQEMDTLCVWPTQLSHGFVNLFQGVPCNFKVPALIIHRHHCDFRPRVFLAVFEPKKRQPIFLILGERLSLFLGVHTFIHHMSFETLGTQTSNHAPFFTHTESARAKFCCL